MFTFKANHIVTNVLGATALCSSFYVLFCEIVHKCLSAMGAHILSACLRVRMCVCSCVCACVCNYMTALMSYMKVILRNN